jgi:hypothetical protein
MRTFRTPNGIGALRSPSTALATGSRLAEQKSLLEMTMV